MKKQIFYYYVLLGDIGTVYRANAGLVSPDVEPSRAR